MGILPLRTGGLWAALGLSSAWLVAGCTVQPMRVPFFDSGPTPTDGGPMDAGPSDTGVPHDVGNDVGRDAPLVDGGLSPDAACESRTSQATITRDPADIIFVIDNSNSMAPAIAAIRDGLNDFAASLVASDLDYRVIMLAQRGTGAQAICIPEPLAGPACADNAPNFFQIDVDILSTQPIEQILGTLAQTPGYTASDSRGGPPWRDLLRDGATRTFVLVSDDNQRTNATFTATALEDFPGGPNPYNSTTLGPGILTSTYGDLFTGYTFDAIYSWGGTGPDPMTNPNVSCGSGTNYGATYTALVERTGGVRGRICDGAAAFAGFFDAIADGVVHGSPIDCFVDIPPAPDGMTFQVGRVNVVMRGTSGMSYVGFVRDAASCDGTRGGWYYDDMAHPTQILLCPASCDTAQAEVVGPDTGLDVQFGCQTIII